MKKPPINFALLLDDIYRLKSEITIIRTLLVKNANDPEKVRSLARQLEKLL